MLQAGRDGIAVTLQLLDRLGRLLDLLAQAVYALHRCVNLLLTFADLLLANDAAQPVAAFRPHRAEGPSSFDLHAKVIVLPGAFSRPCPRPESGPDITSRSGDSG